MSDGSKIEWTDASWNPTRGCSKIAQGCKNCYAETFAERFRGVPGHAYERGFDPRTAPEQLTVPLRWKKPRRIFVDSMSDLFHEAFSFEYIAACFGVMASCRRHTFQILTKRPARAAEWFEWAEHHLHAAPFVHESLEDEIRELIDMSVWPLPNVWIGTSIAEQKDADKNIPHLLQIPAAVRFLSVEPLLGPVDLSPWLRLSRFEQDYRDLVAKCGGEEKLPAHLRWNGKKPPTIDWVILGGESGHGARPCDVEWIRSIVAQCKAAGVPPFVKQLGAKPIARLESFDVDFARGETDWPDDTHWTEPGDGYAHPLLDPKGGDMAKWPRDLRIREFPNPRMQEKTR